MALTEVEIFDRMQTSIRSAIQHCEDLARLPLVGPTYDAFRKEIKLIEGCCRQAAVWRQDARWYPLGLQMAKAHETAGRWLRGAKDPQTGANIALSPIQRRDLFMKLAANLKNMYAMADRIKTMRTHRAGMILPTPQAHTPENRSMGWRRSGGGILLPGAA